VEEKKTNGDSPTCSLGPLLFSLSMKKQGSKLDQNPPKIEQKRKIRLAKRKNNREGKKT